MMSPPAGFAAKLRWWRAHRGLSQLELAGRAEISQRHLSFLELGRSAPSRPMVLRLAVVLDVPLRQQNALLLAAGFAPLWRETALAAPELAQVRGGLEYILRQQEPFPAVVVDRCWNLIQANAGAVRLVEFLLGPLAPEVSINLADALVGPDLLRPFLVNWDDYFVRSVEADAAADGSAETTALLRRLLAYAGVGAVVKQTSLEPSGPVPPLHFRKGEISLALFTTIATLGTPQDITLQELRIKCFFAMDEGTAAIFRSWAGGQTGR
jgi:transcriptional regulator with XRE-family HTH domain